MVCPHESCGNEGKIWLNLEDANGHEAALHPWCIHCGLVKNISDDKPKKVGYWMNVLSKISYNFLFTKCQKRLISKELQSYDEFEDLYGITGSSQKEIFIQTIRKYCNVCKNDIDSFVC